MNRFGGCDGTDFFSDMHDEFFLKFSALRGPADQGDKGIQRLPFDFVRDGCDGGFCDRGMTDQGAFDFGGADAMAGHVDHVIDAAHEPVIPFIINTTAIAGEVEIFEDGKVDIDEAFVIAPHGSHDAGPGFGDAEFSAFIDVTFGIVVTENYKFDAEEGASGTTRFNGVSAGQGGQQMSTRFGLPPGIDNRAFPATDFVVIPHPGFWIDGFPYRSENAEGGDVMLFDPFVTQGNEGTNGCRCGVEGGDFVFFNDLPITARIWIPLGRPSNMMLVAPLAKGP